MWLQWGVGNARQLLRMCLRGLVVILLTWHHGAVAQQVAADPFPVPDVLRPNVAFWTRVFTALDVRSGVLHDANDVTIVYHTLHSLPSHRRQRQRLIDRHRRHYQRILYALARGQNRPHTHEEKRVVALFPEEKRRPSLFRAAARTIRFQQGLRDRFARGLVRSGAYLPAIEQIFAAAGLPAALALLPHIESSFNNRAHSKAKAVGIWQFISRTGRRFLTINAVIDERLDVPRATVAAAKLLQENYRALGTWPLAITAYNHGAHGMKRAMTKLGSKNFGTIVQRYRSRSFGFASKNFYAEFLAVIAIVPDYKTYFGALTFDTPPVYHTLTLDAYMDISTLETYLGLTRQEIARWNPSLRRFVLQGQRRIPAGFELKIPSGHVPATELHKRWASIPSQHKFSQQVRVERYWVQSGDTLSTIARRFTTTTRALAALNGIERPDKIRIGQTLQLPVPSKQHRLYQVRPPLPSKQHRLYQVRPGDTLSTIAHRLRTTVAFLAELNDITRPYRIRIGQLLRTSSPIPAVAFP